MVLGPLDKRAIRTRCQACARRRIKCEGDSPCAYCTKKKIPCVPPPANKNTGVVFVNDSPQAASSASKHPPGFSTQTLQIPKILEPSRSTDYIAYFFSVFIVRNDFSGGCLDMDGIVANFQSSSSLHHAAIAVGALNASKEMQSLAGERKAATITALSSYKTSLVSFQKEIQHRDIKENDAALWTTLFLGLFELMYDVTGESWVKHILYGTSRMLQLRGPDAHLTGRGRSFFLTVRIFEISRSLAFAEPTFLNEKPWVELMDKIWMQDVSDWHPKEKMYDLMLEAQALGEKVWDAINGAVNPSNPLDKALVDLATEGRFLRQTIDNWYKTFMASPISSGHDPWSLLAMIYYHAISIYLAGIFDYRPEFNMILFPNLSVVTVQAHVCSIISQTQLALSTTNVAGALFLFPLRVAGARAITEEQRTEIIDMLTKISTRSFVVAEAFKLDLRELWDETRVQEGSK